MSAYYSNTAEQELIDLIDHAGDLGITAIELALASGQASEDLQLRLDSIAIGGGQITSRVISDERRWFLRDHLRKRKRRRSASAGEWLGVTALVVGIILFLLFLIAMLIFVPVMVFLGIGMLFAGPVIVVAFKALTAPPQDQRPNSYRNTRNQDQDWPGY